MYNNQGYPGGEQPQQPYYGPPQQGGYPPPQGGYPPPQGNYPPAQGGFPPPQGHYPPQQGYPFQPGAQPQGQPYNPMPAPMPIATPPPQKKSGGVNGCLSGITGLVVLVLLIVGLTSFTLFVSEKAGSKTLDPQSSSYFKVVEMGVGKRIAVPGDPLYKPKSTFQRNNIVAIGFELDFAKMDFKKQAAYYSTAKFFQKHWLLDLYTEDEKYDEVMKIENDGLAMGVHTISDLDDTGKWKAELYWCEKSDCSDAKLARSLDFVIE